MHARLHFTYSTVLLYRLVQIEEFLANGTFADLKKEPEAETKKTEDAEMAMKFL